jgi:hypothetical protein
MPTAQNSASSRPRSWFAVVLRDEHFWIPLVVLVGGLVVLRWIA